MDERIERIHNEIYNLILDTEIHKNERDILIYYKTQLENRKNEQRLIMELAEELRQLSVSGICRHKSLSPKLALFYKEIATYGQLTKNLASGVISFGLIR